MILDQIGNVELYRNFSSTIYAGLKFIASVKPDIALGSYNICSGVKVLVTEYETLEVFERGYEAHRRVIDIQYPIIGLERVKWSPIKGMDINIPYDAEKDRTFYRNPSPQGTIVDIGQGIFAIMFPQDGHSPQHFIDKPELIKKITVKVSI